MNWFKQHQIKGGNVFIVRDWMHMLETGKDNWGFENVHGAVGMECTNCFLFGNKSDTIYKC